jgi:hypothetical protein
MWGTPSGERTGMTLQLRLVLGSVVILGSGLRLETTPIWRARSTYLYPPGTGWSSYTLRHWVAFSVASYDLQGYGGSI